jgi:Ca2+-binding RTX toxin-like protein
MMRAWVRQLRKHLSGSHGNGATVRRRPRRVRLELQTLEDRLVPTLLKPPAGVGVITGGTLMPVTVANQPSPASFAVSAPGTAVAGAGFSVTITAKDQTGNPVTNYSGPVTLTSSDGQTVTVSQGTPTLSNGSATVSVTLDTADATTLTAHATSVTGTSTSITVSPAAVAALAVHAPSAAIAGAGFGVTITAVDPYGNPVTSYTGAAALTSSDNQQVFVSPGTITLTNGTATVAATLTTADTLTLKATSGTLTGGSGNIAVSPAVASFTVSAPSTATAGTGFSVTVTGLDPFGNVVAGYNGPVTLTSSDGQPVQGLPSPLLLSNGSATVTATLNTANTVTLTAGAGLVQGASGAIAVGPAAAATFTVSAPGTVAAGAGSVVTLTAKDAFGNTVTGYSGPVTWTSSDGQTVSVTPATLTWSNGTASATVTLNKLGSPTLKATAGGVGGSSGTVVVESPAAQAISSGLAALVSWAAGQSFPLVGTVTAVQNALQAGLVNPINTYLAQNPTTSAGFLTLLQHLSAQIGGLTVTVDPTAVVQKVSGNAVTISLDFQATQTAATALGSLGAQADGLGIRLDPSTKVNVTTSLNFNFSFGIDASQNFFVQAPAGGLSAQVSINATGINSAITIGFLGAQATNGSVQLSAQATNAAAVNNVSTGGLQNGALALTTTGSLNVALPLQAQLGGQTASGTLTISQANLASGSPAVQFQGFNGWQNFTTVGPDAVMAMLNQLGSQLGQLGTQLWTTNLPFLNNVTLVQAVNLGQAFQAEVTSQISSWSATLHRTVTNFTTAQDLAALLAQVLDLTPAQINIQFDPTTNRLSYHLNFSAYTFSSLLPQQLQVNLNQGGLANASLGSSQLSLVPKVLADLTVGIDLTPLGHGFVLQPTTPLSSLNGGAGVHTNGTSAADIQVTLTDGASFQVDLDGSRTVQDVINAIQSASGGKVQVTIDPTSPVGLDITQVTAPQGSTSSTSPNLTVTSVNGSHAAEDLGIAGADVARTGTLTGQSLSGDSLQKHVFLQNATFQAGVDGTASQVNASATLGGVGLQMTNGSGSIHVQGTLTLRGPTTLQQLTDALRGSTSLSSLVSAQVSGNARLDLPFQLKAPLPGVTVPAGAEVAVAWPDITNPSTLSVTVTPALDLPKLTIQPVLQALQNVQQFVQTQGAALLRQPIPGLGHSLADLVDLSAALTGAVSNLTLNPPATIDELVNRLGTLLGQSVSVSFANDVLQLNLSWQVAQTQNLTLGFNLSPSLGSIADANGSAPLSLAINGSVALGLNIDLSHPATPQYALQDSSTIKVGALVNATGVSFSATVGPLGLSVAGGTVRLDNGKAGSPATWTLGLRPSSVNHQWSLAGAAGAITSAVQGQVNIVLPTFFPTPDRPLDPAKPNIELHVAGLSNPGGTTTTVVPNFAAALGGVNLNGIMNQVVNGWDGVIRMLQSALTRQINATKIPVVGTQLQQALAFLQQLDSSVTSQLQNAPQITAAAVQDALYTALGPQGLNWLVNLTPGGAATPNNYVQVQQSNGADHYLLKLHENLASVNAPVAANLGLDGLGLKINGNVTLNAGFDAVLGFGISQANGFYVDSSDTAQVNFTAQLPTSATATLGFLQLSVTPATSTPQLTGDLHLGLNNVNGTGRLSVGDLASASAHTVGMDASANVKLHFDATIGGNTNLPHLSTDFYFTWSLNPTAASPNTLGFTNVTLDLGGFIDGIAQKIGSALAPIKPLADVLSAPLPVLSQLAGHKVDLVDLASALGFCSPSTAQFINAVATFVGGDSLNVPPSVNLGSFTLDPTSALNAAALGNLNPQNPSVNAGAGTISDSSTGGSIPGFQIPILSNPTSAFQLLLGKDVPLVTYEMPALNLNFAFSEFFPIIGPLGADLAGEIGATAQFGFGFDTRGLREYSADKFRDPGLILDGFYVSDRANPDGTGPVVPQVQLYGSIAAYAALDLGIVQAGVGGGLFASINFSIHDPSGTGKVHLQDLVADVKKGTIFDASGALKAFLDAYVEIDLGFFSHRWDFHLASVTLAQIGQHPTVPDTTPQLASEDASGVLRLNIGAYAPQRLYGNTSDGNETLSVTAVPNKPGSVYVSGFGVQNQEYDNVTKIVADGVAGSDTITVNVPSNIDVDLAVGGGTNSFDVQGAGNVTLTGGAGTDTLEVDSATSATLIGGPGTEVLQAGNVPGATLRAGAGRDALYGGSGAGQVLYGSSGTDLLVGGSGANQVLHGGSGTATVVGGSGAGQQLFGDTSTANLFGGTGSNQVLTAGTGNDYLYAGEADGQVLWGGSGTDVLQVGWQPQNSAAPVSFGNMPVGATDGTGQPLQVGWHLQESLTAAGWTVTNYTPGDANQGAGHAYVMHAGSGDTLIIGGFGDDTLYGGSGNDTLYGGGGNGTKVLYAGTGATQLFGGGPGDNVNPSTGTHILYGGSGNDVLYGGDGVNITVNATGTGLINPSGDSGDNGVNILVAGSGNSTLYADGTGSHENTLIAGSGRDNLYAGGTSGDYLEAGSGIDALYGGSGNDIFQLPFIPAGQQASTPDTMVGGLGLTTLVLRPVQTVMVNGQLTQVGLTQDSDVTLTPIAGTTNRYEATLRDLDSENLVGRVDFTLPDSVQRVALLGGNGDNKITVDPAIHRGTFLYGGPGHNILTGGSGNDVLVGGAGTSVLQGGSGDDVLYGGAIPAQYQQMLNTLGASQGNPPASGASTQDALMNWLRQQPPGHNYLIAGPGSSQLYAGDGGDLLIGGSAHFDPQQGQFVLDPGASRDFLSGGKGNDLLLAGPGSPGAAEFAGSGNDVLVGGDGENILQGGPGNDLLLGGSLINIIQSNSTATTAASLVGGSGLNFEFAGAGSDVLYDYADPASWARAQAVATTFHLNLPLPRTNAVNPIQQSDALKHERDADYPEWHVLDTVALNPNETGAMTAGSNKITGLALTRLAGNTTAGSNKIGNLASTAQLIEGQYVTGPGIPAGSVIVSIDSTSSITVSGNATATAAGVQLGFGNPLLPGMTVSGPGIPDGTTIASVDAANAIALSNNVTASASAATLTVGLNAQQQARLQQLNNEFALMDLADQNIHRLGPQGSTVLLDYLQGGSGTNSLYAGPDAAWMVGGANNGNHTFYITPANFASFANDVIQGGTGPNETLMFQADGNIGLRNSTDQTQDLVTINNQSASWTEGHGISTVGVQTLGRNDTVTIGSAKFGAWTQTIRVVDGGDATHQGNVLIDATAFTEQGLLLGGVGSDTIKIDKLAFGSVVQGGTGNNQHNELDVLADSSGAQVTEGINPVTKQEDLLVGGVGVGAYNFQKLVLTGGAGPNTFQTDGKIATTVLEGGSGTNLLTAYGGNNTLIGGSGTNTLTASGGTSTLIGGTGPNTFNLSGAGTYNVIGGAGTNVINASGSTSTLMGGSGPNTFNLSGVGTYTAIGGTGPNSFVLHDGSGYAVTGGAGTNQLTVQCDNGGDAVHLVQSGSTITVTGAVSATATNLNGVVVRGSSAGNNVLDASHTTMGVSLLGVGPGNTLNGGAGSDILDGGPGGKDTLVAGNNSDLLYVSGSNSNYQGTGSNTLAYRAQPRDNVIVYGDGLLVNPSNYNNPLTWNGNASTRTGTLVPFGKVSGLGNVLVEDGTGTASARLATSADLPGTKVFTDEGSNYVNGYTTAPPYGNNFVFNVQPGQSITIYTSFSALYENDIDLWDTSPRQRITYWNNYFGHKDDQGSPNFSEYGGIQWTNTSGSVHTVFLAGFHKNSQPTWLSPLLPWNFSDVMIDNWQSPLPNSVTIGWRDISTNPAPYMNATATVYFSWVSNVVQTGYNTTAPLWTGGTVTVAPGTPTLASGSNVPLLPVTVPATGTTGAVVNYPQAYTGGASPGTAVTYSIPNGSTFPVGTTAVTATATDGSGRKSTATFNVIVLPAGPVATPAAASSASAASAQAVADADQLDVSIGQFVDQAGAGATFAGSATPLIQQIAGLESLALQQAASFQPYSAFAQGVETFLNDVVAGGLTGSAFVQQQVVNLNASAAGGLTTTPAAQGLLWFLDNVYFGGLTAAPFTNTTVTSAPVTANGTVWFTCANGALGYSQTGQGAVAVTLNNAPVQIASLVVAGDGTAWFATADGQSAYCRNGQSTATLDPLAGLVLSASGSSTAGATVAVTVTAQDAAGNVILDYPGTVQFSSSDQQAGLPASYTFTAADQGSHVFNVVLKTAGAQTVTATAGTVSGQASVQVAPAAAASFAVSAPAAATAGTGLAVTVTAKDAYGNTVTGYTGTAQFSSSDQQAGLPASYTFTTADQGSHVFNVVLKTAGAQTITASTGLGSLFHVVLGPLGAQPILPVLATVSGQATVQVAPAGAASFAVSAPGTVTAGVAFSVTITARDAYGNTVTGYSGPVTLASSDGENLNLPAGGIVLSGGTATVTVTLDTAHAVTLTASAGSLTGSGSVTVNAAAAAKLILVTAPPSSVKINTAFGATVQVEDQFGNNVSGVGVSIQQTGGSLTGGGAVTTNPAGQAVFTNLQETQVGTFPMDATGAGLTSASVETNAHC